LKKRKESPLDFKGNDNLASHLDSYVDTDLAILAEEVVDGICLGHVYGQSSTASADLPVLLSHNHAKHLGSRNNVNVSIDVQHQDWVYRTQPGALRRIIMNIFGNAMKYTDEGRVSLNLEAVSHSEGRSRRQGLEDMVTLTVTDTGRGISEEFLRGKLYTPFAQEDSLAVGTGLGLSIVRSLVKALNGHIRVRSRLGEGTIVRVTLPLARPVGEESPPFEPHTYSVQQREILTQTLMLREGYPGRRAAIWGADPECLAQNETWGGIAKYLTEWFGIEIVAWPCSLPLDILLIREGDLQELRNVELSAILPSLLIFCSKPVDYSMAPSEWLPLASSVEIIRRPCGPHKLARSVLKCLRNSRSTVVTGQNPHGKHLSCHSDSGSTDDTRPHVDPEKTVGTDPTSLGEFPPDAPSVISAPPEVIAAAPLPKPLVEGPIEATRPTRVLVVDDNRINLNLMMTFMKKRRLSELVSAENGKLAVEAVERMPTGFDIIFMDMSMPVMNGFEATRAIRSLERESEDRRPAIIIALTGLSSSRDESEALASGVDFFLTKPVSLREVSRLLDEWERDSLPWERKYETRGGYVA
jgi:CheY-like chemotaxis protein